MAALPASVGTIGPRASLELPRSRGHTQSIPDQAGARGGRRATAQGSEVPSATTSHHRRGQRTARAARQVTVEYLDLADSALHAGSWLRRPRVLRRLRRQGGSSRRPTGEEPSVTRRQQARRLGGVENVRRDQRLVVAPPARSRRSGSGRCVDRVGRDGRRSHVRVVADLPRRSRVRVVNQSVLRTYASSSSSSSSSSSRQPHEIS